MMKKLTYFLLASMTAFSYAKTVPQLTLYEYMYLDTNGKQEVMDYVTQEYGNMVAVGFKFQIETAFSLAKAQCANPENIANFYKKKCNEMNKELKKMTLGDFFEEMEKNL